MEICSCLAVVGGSANFYLYMYKLNWAKNLSGFFPLTVCDTVPYF